MKYYVVFVGHRPGIYNSWPEAHQQIFRFSGAVYQKASSLEEATSMYQEWLSNREFTTKEGLAVGRKVDGPAVGRKVCCESEQGSITACLWSDLGIDCVRNPVFFDWEVNEQKVKAEIGEMSKNPQGLLLEAIHSVGYSGALANPLLAPETALNRLNSSILEEFVTENYIAPRLVLAASGVEHEELVQYAKPLLSDLPKVARPEVPKSVYVGGDYRCQYDSQTAHVALAFEVPGGWLNEKEAMTLTVLQMLMGGGGSFSAGGPGKGMYSRLYLRVLNEFSTNPVIYAHGHGGWVALSSSYDMGDNLPNPDSTAKYI